MERKLVYLTPDKKVIQFPKKEGKVKTLLRRILRRK